MTLKKSDVERLNCWNYLGPFSISRSGLPYGRFAGIGAHRLSYETHKGTIPNGLTIDHLCRNTICINPRHLEAVTLKENILRGERLKHCKNGHPIEKVFKNGQRRCLKCYLDYHKSYRLKYREKRNQGKREHYWKNRERILAQKRIQYNCPEMEE